MDTCVLFFHHKNDELTRHHWELLQKHNPNCHCMAIWCNDGGSTQHLEEALEIKCTHQTGSNHSNIDLIWRQWFISHGQKLDHKRYIWAEYDANCQVALSEWYADVWDADVAASRIFGRDWWWSDQIRFLPAQWRPHASGLAPINGLLLSRKALTAYAIEPVHESLYCELRLATFLKFASFKLTSLPEKQAQANGWPDDAFSGERVAGLGRFTHPVKSL
jgi:hypothetical protein